MKILIFLGGTALGGVVGVAAMSLLQSKRYY